MQFITQLIFNFLTLATKITLAGSMVLLIACSTDSIEPEKIDIKSPGPKSKTFAATFNSVWKASLLTLGKYPLKSYDEEAGIIETDYIRGDSVWIAPHKDKYVPGGYRYKINVRIIKGKPGPQSQIKVVVLKQPELQKDFFSNSEKIQTDGLEELSLLYRIEREIAIEQSLMKVKRTN